MVKVLLKFISPVQNTCECNSGYPMDHLRLTFISARVNHGHRGNSDKQSVPLKENLACVLRLEQDLRQFGSREEMTFGINHVLFNLVKPVGHQQLGQCPKVFSARVRNQGMYVFHF